MAKTAAQRKADQRKREAEHLEKMGAEQVVYTMFRGTRERLDQIKKDHGFEEDAEVFTLLIHNLKDCDMSRQSELLKVPQKKTA
jgi:hypothetical protein